MQKIYAYGSCMHNHLLHSKREQMQQVIEIYAGLAAF